jgi:hypothetical protein
MSNASKALPEVEIDFGGETKKLIFSTLAFCLLEDATGKNALDGETWAKPDMRLMTTMLWAGLRTHNKELTLDEVREKLSVADLMKSYQAIIKSFAQASPPE